MPIANDNDNENDNDYDNDYDYDDDEDDIDLQRAAMSPATAMPLATCHMMIQT